MGHQNKMDATPSPSDLRMILFFNLIQGLHVFVYTRRNVLNLNSCILVRSYITYYMIILRK
jgi:hypothetical protein